jgi:glycogen operon protein
MILAGDEFGRTQNGNNNAYCQDNEISWVNWDIDEYGQSLIGFVTRVAELRRRFPILRRNRFLTEAYNEELDIKELTWVNPGGGEMQQGDWDAGPQCIGLMLDGRAQPSGIRRRGEDVTVLIVLNAWHDVVQFTLPAQGEAGQTWNLMIDTNLPDAEPEREARKFSAGDVYEVTGRSLLLFAQAPAPALGVVGK